MSDELKRNLDSFHANPGDDRAFEALEEHYFLNSEWSALIELYRKRATDPAIQKNPRAHAPLLFRLGQVLEDRCRDQDAALDQYLQIADIHPQFRPAMRQARQILAARSDWNRVLEIAEREEQAGMKPYERASFLTEMGNVWLTHLSDPEKALGCFDRALESNGKDQSALEGRARVLQALDRLEEAVETRERLAGLQRGTDRAITLVAMAQLCKVKLEQPERAEELYRRALTEDPRNEDAIEALSLLAAEREQWPLVADLYDRRYELAATPERRTAIALEAGSHHLERLEQPEAARMWIERARDASPDDVSVHYALADVERRAGNTGALLQALDRATAMAEDGAPLGVLVEAANLHLDRGNDDRALELLRRAHERKERDPEILDALSRVLIRLGRDAEAVEILEQRAETAEDPRTKAECLVRIGRAHEEDLDDPEAARKAFERAFDVQPDAPGVAARLERTLRKAESWEALRDFLERARREGPEEERAAYHSSFGEVLIDRFEDPAGAARAFEAALEIDPKAGAALQGMQKIASDSGDEDALLRAYEIEASASPDASRLEFLVWEIHRLLEARKRFHDALPWMEKLLEVSPGDGRALDAAVVLHENLGQREEQLPLLERLDGLTSGAEQATVRKRRAAILHELGRSDEAILAYEAVLESEPNDLESLRTLAAAYEEDRRLEDLARVRGRLATQLPPEERAPCMNELARLLEEQIGDVEGAIGVLRDLAELDEAPDDVPERLENLLERNGRHEELIEALRKRRQTISDDSDEAIRLDLKRARLLRDRMGNSEEAMSLLRAARARARSSVEVADELEETLRAGTDRTALADFLEERAAQEPSRLKQARLEYEYAVIRENEGELDRPRAVYEKLADRCPDEAIAVEASERLEALLERSGDWRALRERLESTLGRGPIDQDIPVYERLAVLCLDGLGDRDGCIQHLEALGRIVSTRSDVWKRLAPLYQESGRTEDAIRAMDAELATDLDTERERTVRVQAARLLAGMGSLEPAAEHYARVLEIEPTHAEASEFLVDHHERNDRPQEMVRLLEARLAAGSAASGGNESAEVRTSLRLRIASVRSDRLDDAEGAIETLEPAIEELGPVASVAEPLAALYERTGRVDSLVDLCGSASEACSAAEERASWRLRLGDALRERGAENDATRAVAAYQGVLSDRSDDRHARAALIDLYRQLEEFAPLATLLAEELARQVEAEDATALRMELAGLLAGPLQNPEAALEHYRRVIDSEPANLDAFERAFALTDALERHEDLLSLVDGRIAVEESPRARASLLERRGELLAGPLARPPEAAAAYREVLLLDPERRGVRRALRDVLEGLERWPAVLHCLEAEARAARGSERVALLERAVEIASAHVGPDAALAWLERLRAERSDDPTVVARIADVHRREGRPVALLRAIEGELSLVAERARRGALQMERARILECDLESPARALAALRDAHELTPDDPEILEALEGLCARTGRVSDQVEIVEARIRGLGVAPPGDLVPLHRRAAGLWAGPLSDAKRAVPHLLRAVSLCLEGSTERLELLRELGDALRASDRVDLSARAREAELSALASDQTGRRAELLRELAGTYRDELGRPDAALHHFRTLVDLNREHGDAPLLDSAGLEEVEQALLEGLRATHEHLELERRLSLRLERGAGDTDEWLELARLRNDPLGAHARARDAYREVLARRPDDRAAMGELCSVLERLGSWPEVAETLQRELELQLPQEERAGLLRRLGEVCCEHLDEPERALRAHAEALELEPSDLVSMRALEELHRMRDEWQEELRLSEREVETLGDEEPARRQIVWLRIGALARDRAEDPPRALRAYERAAEVGDLPTQANREWAELYRTTGDRARYVEVFARWCDDAAAEAACENHLALVHALEDMGRDEEAIQRARIAIERYPDEAAPWDAAARVHEGQGEVAEASRALERAAERMRGSEATRRLVHAGTLIEAADPERACQILRRALEEDPGCAQGMAHLARIAATVGEWEEAQQAAGRALDVGVNPDVAPDLDADLRFKTSMAGGHSARELGRMDAAARFYAGASELDPHSPEALEGEADALIALGDLQGAGRALEKRLALPGENPNRARHLTIVARSFEARGERDEALGRFREALRLDSGDPDAHDGVIRMHADAGRIDEAVAACEAWAQVAPCGEDLAARLMRAAKLELANARTESAEAHLRASVEADPTAARAWLLLVELLWEGGRLSEAFEASSEALRNVRDAGAIQARISLVHARLLESRGESCAATEAYAEAAKHDTRCMEAALAQAALLGEASRWSDAAEVLGNFVDRHPDPDEPSLARVLHERGRLLAGPLGDVEEAVRCYEKAVALEPTMIEARESLARLLTHLPGRWCDAVEHHRSLLAENPVRADSLRDLVAIARQRGDAALIDTGLVLLQTLEIDRPDGDVPSTLPLRLAETLRLEPETWEKLRHAAQVASSELGEVLDVSKLPLEADAEQGTVAAFRAALHAAEGELSAPALVRLPPEALASTMTALVTVALDPEAARGTQEAERLSRRVGRRTRNKLRRALEGVGPSDVDGVDFEAWQRELQGLAAASAVDRTGGDLRSALIALSEEGARTTDQAGSEGTDRCAIHASESARRLLTHVTSAWCARLAATT